MKMFRQYNNKFYSNLKKVEICNIITIIIAFLCIVSQIIQCIFNINEWNFFKSNWETFVFAYITAICFSTTFFEKKENLNKGKTQMQYFGETKWKNDYRRFLLHIISSLFYLIFTVFMTILGLILTGKIAGVLWSIMGRTFLFYIPIYIADIFLIKNLKIIKIDFENNPPKYKLKDIEAQKENKEKEEMGKIFNIMERVGIKFFIENYFIIKNRSLIDAIDSIGNNLPYDEKKERVQFAKGIFENGLEIKTLNFLKNEKLETLDEATKEKLNLILKQI